MRQILIILLLFMHLCVTTNAQDTTLNTTPSYENSYADNQNMGNLEQSTTSDNFWLWLVVILQGAVLFFCIVMLFIRTHSQRIKDITVNSERLNQKFVSKKDFFEGKSNGNVNMFEGKIQRLERMFGDLQKRFDDYSSTLKGDNKSTDKTAAKQENVIYSQPAQIVSSTTQTQKEIKYLKQRNGSIFNQISDSIDGCHFQMFDIKTNSAKFKFCGKEDYAINNRNEVFDDVCEVSGSSYNAKRVLHEENGEVSLQDGKWNVIKKAKIKFL